MADGWVIGDRYRIHDRVGAGGMAEVFRATDLLLDRPVAVKVFRTAHVSADAPSGVARQQTELQALARLNHPNLITLYDGSITSSPAYLVMELIDGPSLGARIAQGPLPEAEVREIGAQVADGLSYVHAQGMVHRDVKPDNILLGVDRSSDDMTVRARLSDFGIVRLLGAERMTSVDFTLGTASYLAPEQARGSGVEPPADVYSLALVLIECLTGRRSFEGPPIEAAMARLSNRPGIPVGLPAPWPQLLHAMTELNPAARPTAAQVARALRAPSAATDSTTFIPAAAGGFASASTTVLGATHVPAAASPPPPLPPVAPRPLDEQVVFAPEDRRRNGLLITAGVLALVVIVAGVILAVILSGGGDSPSAGSSTTTSPSKTASKTKPASRTRSAHASSSRPSSSTQSAPSSQSSTSSSRSSSSASSTPPSTSSTPSTTSTAPSTSATRSTGASSTARTSSASQPASTPARSSASSPPAAPLLDPSTTSRSPRSPTPTP